MGGSNQWSGGKCGRHVGEAMTFDAVSMDVWLAAPIRLINSNSFANKILSAVEISLRRKDRAKLRWSKRTSATARS